MKRFLTVFFVLALIFTMTQVGISTAFAAESGGYTYIITGTTAEITGYTGGGGGVGGNTIVIPRTLGGLEVTSIGVRAFFHLNFGSSITESTIIIPDSVTSIGEYAFSENSLANVIIPDSVTSIGNFAFAGCMFLRNITIPNSVTSIGEGVFRTCMSLKSVIIPESVTSIGNRAFEYCSLLKSVTISNRVTSIGDSAFKYCSLLAGVIIPNSLTSIGDSAFYRSGLESVTFGNNVVSIGNYAFYGDGKLTKAYFLGNAPALDIGATVFKYCAANFVVIYSTDKTGFTRPTWYGYKTFPLTEPLNLIAAYASYNRIKLTWTAVTGADGYGIFLPTGPLGKYTLITNRTTNSYISYSLPIGSNYNYMIRAYKTVGTSKVYGNPSSTVGSNPVPATPASLKAVSSSYNSIKLTWTAVNGAHGYGIFRSTSASGIYMLFTNTATNSYINYNLSTGATYYYKIGTYRIIGGIKVYSIRSSAVSAKPIPSTPTSFKAVSASDNSIKLTWTAVGGANGYGIYRSATALGTYSYLSNTSTTGYTNTGLATGTAYYYKIRAYRNVGSIKVYGILTSAVSAKPV